MIRKKGFLFICLSSISYLLFSQEVVDGDKLGRTKDDYANDMRVISTAVPFLSIAPDSRAGAMGDVGVATTPDINSMHWNPSKYAFIPDEFGIGISYTPWLKNLVDGMHLLYLSGYYRLDKMQVISSSLLYFSIGEIIFTNDYGQEYGQYSPNEFALDVAYSRLFSERFSGGMAFRFVRSDLTGGTVTSGGGETKAGISFAADVSTYYQNNDLTISDKNADLAFGLNISNIGRKLSYSKDQEPQYIPINLRLGSALTIDMDEYNSITFALDFNKLLVPTPPVYLKDSQGTDSLDANGDRIIISGEDPYVPVARGIIQSFYDAPGGYKEEFNEIMYSFGIEYLYREQFAIRGGYFHEHQNKGNRKYFSLGIGVKYNVLLIDFAYLVPTSGRNNPLANTVRFTLNFNFSSASQ